MMKMRENREFVSNLKYVGCVRRVNGSVMKYGENRAVYREC